MTLNKALWGHQMELIVEGVVQNKLANTHKQTHTHEHILRAVQLLYRCMYNFTIHVCIHTVQLHASLSSSSWYSSLSLSTYSPSNKVESLGDINSSIASSSSSNGLVKGRIVQGFVVVISYTYCKDEMFFRMYAFQMLRTN